MQITEISKSKTFQIITWVLALLVIIFISFSAGVHTGFNKASHNFERRGMSPKFMPHGSGTPSMFLERGELSETHGLSGIVSNISSTTIIVEDRNGEDRNIAISEFTRIRSGGNDIAFTDIKTGDFIIVFGDTDNNENISPKLIRVLPKFEPNRK